ncbi:MAG TPA: sensor histidine kinase [Thermomicrobiales bacterium]|nr:sensor histidine kinase [Thermomicrobiales bacterium]
MVQATNTTNSRLPAMPPSPASDMGTLNRLLTSIWPLFAVGWLTFVIAGPVAEMLNASDTRAEMLMVLVCATALTSAYLWLTLYKPFRIDVSTAERRSQHALLVLLTGLVLYVDLANSTGYFWVFICVAIPAGVVLPTRTAAWVVVALTGLAAGVEVFRLELEMIRHVPGIAIWGVAAIMWRRQILIADELRTAHEELARLAVTEERLRFARDLHDLLGHSLSLIALKSELAGRLAQSRSQRAAEEIADIERVARRSLREVRDAVAGYRQPALDAELDGVRDMLLAAGIESRIDVATGALPPPVDATLAWTVREAVTNVIRHSCARCCSIRIWRDGGSIRADVIDDGRGVPGEPSETICSGLAGISERAAACGGTVEAGPGKGGGFALSVAIPVVRELQHAPRLADLDRAVP